MKKLIFTLALLSLSGCGDIDDISEEDIKCIIETGKPCPDSTPVATPTVAVATPTPIRTPAKTPTPSKATPVPTVPSGMNPLCSGIMDSRQHLLYKPKSDTTGNAVVVFDGKYKKEFKTVKLELRTGKYEDLYWKGLVLWGNPDTVGPRQHWRSQSRCQSIKDKAFIVADDGYQVCKFQIPGNSCNRWE